MFVRIVSTLAVLPGLATCSASGEEHAAPDRPALSGPESRDGLVHGRVLDDGKPVEDAVVGFQIWPDGEVDDFVNFDVQVESDGDMTSWSTTAHLLGADRIWRSEPEAQIGDRVLELAVDPSEETVETTTSTGETTREDLPVSKVGVAS